MKQKALKIYKEFSRFIDVLPKKWQIAYYYIVGTTLAFLGVSVTTGTFQPEVYITGLMTYIGNILAYEGKEYVLKSEALENKK